MRRILIVGLLAAVGLSAQNIVLKNVRGAVHDGAFPEQILLGMSFLGRLDMRRQGGVLELEKKY